MTLLSPFTLENADKIARGKNSEYMQLKDTRTALNMLMYARDTELVVGALRVPVRLKSNHLNLPVNTYGQTLKKMEPRLQEEINARVFINSNQNMQTQVKPLEEMMVVMDAKGENLVKSLKEYYENENYTSSPRGAQKLEDAVSKAKTLEAELRDAYGRWHDALIFMWLGIKNRSMSMIIRIR